MREMLEEKLSRFEFLEKQMSDPDVMGNSHQMATIAREHGSLAKLATKYRTFKNTIDEMGEAKELLESDDEEMRELAEADIESLKARREKLWQELLDMTIGGEDANRTRIVLEIRGGAGGDEAALFARDLYEMYKRYAETKKWKYEVMEANPTELGGFKEVIISVEGEGVYRELQYESGGHRVQRVPETEAKGRVHTSAATVAVMPEPEDVEFELSPEDYEVERYAASSGPGGQHVNKTASAVRLIHKDGVIVQCCEERSQHKNLAKALRLLKTKLYEVKRAEEEKQRSDHRKSLVGSGDRSQRIRTYNFPENRVTDHRINLTLYKLDQIIAGAIQPVIDGLVDYDRQQLRGDMGDLEE
ncbi:peptide chain release factor 1 [Blastopirellula sp. J2-11]|uniref:peptide chain release factor 1 n=1 Tax=Blastopirellula sp. J2-11 TaxID=2943192 RepID=UPI0021C87DB5|nr:peptide chain release factor 1 [Blastopirellula sp. J2-11]UUO08441.1 peptide chain release factor 1 [Blastopirellula sp. J2-11]